MSSIERRRYLRNTPGDFYVEDDHCIWCGGPEHVAPDLVTGVEDEGDSHCYFKAQPSTPAQLDRAILAIEQACCGALRYAGRNPYVLRRLVDSGNGFACDHLDELRATKGLKGRIVRLWARIRLRRAGWRHLEILTDADQDSAPPPSGLVT